MLGENNRAYALKSHVRRDEMPLGRVELHDLVKFIPNLGRNALKKSIIKY
jgi:hypothetical protein